jgi:hypothetical protein
VAPGFAGYIGVDVDGDDPARGAHQHRQQGGVVAGASADLQNAAADRRTELLEHYGDNARLRG